MDTVGTQRQYTGTAGRIENAQVAVYLTYAAPRGRALIDRALYMPKCWTDDPVRGQRAGIPTSVEFATKPALARQMITAALDAGVSARFVAGDEVYGNDSNLRTALQERSVGFVLAVACDHRVRTSGGPVRADLLAAGLPRRSWQRLSAGAGTKGHRYYRWAWFKIDDDQPGQHWLLVRRNDSIGEMAYYRCYSPQPTPLIVLVRVAGQRWKIEESFHTQRKGKPDWPNTKSDAGVPGTVGAPWRCSRWPSWPSPPPTNQTATPHPPGSYRRL